MILENCDVEVASTHVLVDPLDRLETPRITTAPCQNDGHILVDNLLPGATIRIYFDEEADASFIGEASGASQVLAVPVGDVRTVRVRQELCGVRSDPSAAVPIHRPEDLPYPRIDPLPYECATKVRIEQVVPGTVVTLISSARGLLARGIATRSEIVFSVPALNHREELYTVTNRCGMARRGGGAEVRNLTDVRPPQIMGPVLGGDRVIRVANITPGATVHLDNNGMYGGSKQFATESGDLPVFGSLLEDGQLRLLQVLCQDVEESEVVEVRACRGQIHVGLYALDPEWLPRLRAGVQTMDERFREFGLRVLVRHEEVLSLPALRVVSVGECRRDPALTDDLRALHRHRNGLGNRDVAIYMVDSILESHQAGCADFDGLPACVASHSSAGFDPWLVAHEVGHVIGTLEHTDRSGNDLPFANLMSNEMSTAGSSRSNVDIEDWQISAMLGGPYTDPC
jgi:hypothetical protein